MRVSGVLLCLGFAACGSNLPSGSGVAVGNASGTSTLPAVSGSGTAGVEAGGVAASAAGSNGAGVATSGAAGTVGGSDAVAAGVSGASLFGGGAGVAGAAGNSGNGGVAGAPANPPAASGVLCVFDYDLTLSTNACATENYDCRTNACITYNWYQQCMSKGARHAIETCVERGAYIGIASHANVDLCWSDKVSVITSQLQFPALTSALRYDNAQADFSYPKIDQRSNWNCDTCAYHMNGGLTKPQLIAKVMAHYGMDAKKASDRAKVIFWDDLPDNITKTNAEMPEVHTVHVHQNIDGQPNSGGCGILDSDVTAGWAAFSR